MLKVMFKVFDGKYSVADPNGFRSKLRQVNMADRAARLSRKDTGASSTWGASQAGRSQLTGEESGIGATSDGGSSRAADDKRDQDDDDGHGDGNNSEEGTVKSSMLLSGLDSVFNAVAP